MFSNYLYSKYNDVLEEKGKDFIDRIQVAAERMQDLIKDMLTFSRVSVDETIFIKTDLNNLLLEVLEEMKDSLKEKKAKVESGSLPTLYVNPVLIRPLFYNLISNACKYSKKDEPPVIKIRSEYTNASNGNGSPNSGYCRIFVEDNGIGFEQKYAEQIFQMFKRLHLNSEFEGTGIGLALCKKIVEKHNGFITAQSKVGEGSIFVISLPMKQPNAVENVPAQNVAMTKSGES
jgi:light-regulated signal transduction histidine kinase (bacteriophytochrome)